MDEMLKFWRLNVCTNRFIFKSYNVFEKVQLYIMILYSTNSCKYSTQIGKEVK